MNENKNLGSYFWRGGKRINVDKEEEVFTVLVNNEAELHQVESLPEVKEVNPVQNRVFKVSVLKDKRDSVMDHIRSQKLKGVCHHAYKPEGASNTRYYLTDRILVKFKPGISPGEIEVVLSKIGLKILKEYPGNSDTFLLQVTNETKMNPFKAANTLAEMEEIDYAEPNLVNRYQKFYEPRDTYFNRQWHLKAWNGPQIVEDADVSATGAWDITLGNRNVVIAIIDDGFDLSHPDFSGPEKIVYAKDYVDGDSNPFPERPEGDYHGTPCAGVALAEENGVGVVGAAPKCSFLPVRFPINADDDTMWEIFDYVGGKADVISCSWGPPPVYAPLSSLISGKFHELATGGGPRKKGCVIVFAAGNNNAPLCDMENTAFVWKHPAYGLVKTEGPIISGEAIHPDVIAVSASTSLNLKAAYSNWGKEISVCAPSDNWHPLDGDTPLPGRGIWTTDNEKFGYGFTGGSRFTGSFGGTSSATPLVAGAAALVISANSNLTAQEVKQILQDSADKIVDANPDPILGFKKGEYDSDGHSEWFGYGRVNASRAVKMAIDRLHEE